MTREDNLRRAQQLSQEQDRARVAREAADNARLVQVGGLRQRNVRRTAMGVVLLLFVAWPAAEWVFKAELALLFVGAAAGVVLGYVLTHPD